LWFVNKTNWQTVILSLCEQTWDCVLLPRIWSLICLNITTWYVLIRYEIWTITFWSG
jgi:hypothetical protein